MKTFAILTISTFLLIPTLSSADEQGKGSDLSNLRTAIDCLVLTELSKDEFHRAQLPDPPSAGGYGAMLNGTHADDIQEKAADAKAAFDEKNCLKVFQDLLPNLIITE